MLGKWERLVESCRGSDRHAESGGQKGSSPGGPETQRGPGFRIVKVECKTTAYGRH